MVATVQSCPTERSFKHLSLAERGFIFALYCEKRSLRYIAQRLNRSVSTVSREIKRGTTTQRRYDSTTYEAYFPETGQAVYEKNRRHCVFQGKFLAAVSFLRFAEQQILQKHWSPDAIVGFCHTQPQWRDEVRVCTKTLYNYIDLALKVRRQNKTSHHRKNKRVLGINIDQCPDHIDARKQFGHW